MTKLQSITRGFAVLLVAFLVAEVGAQWPGDAGVNMVICDRAGEQTLPRMAATSDGGCYVCWYDNTSGNYDLYLQRLNGDGEIQWQYNGLLISNHPQEAWFTDYDMTVDGDDHAIIVFNDIRNGPDWDIYAYRISPEGNFAWGSDGLTISNNDGFEPDPRVTITSNGNIVIAWMEETIGLDQIVHLRKLTSAGDDFWSDPSTITLTSTHGLSVPRIARSDNDGVILQVLVATGPDFWDPKDLYMHKFDSNGDALWGASGIAVSTAGGFLPQMRPDIAADDAGGVFSYWYDARNTYHHVYVQHIQSDGTVCWTPNGVLASTAVGEMQMNPSLVYLPSSEAVMVFYKASNLSQSVFGVQGQKLNMNGERQWSNNGVVLVPLSGKENSWVTALLQVDGAIVTYFENPIDDSINSLVKAIRVDGNGTPVWDTSPVVMTTTVSKKLYLRADVNGAGQVITVWRDLRVSENGDMYLQNINRDGSLGALSTEIPTLSEWGMIILALLLLAFSTIAVIRRRQKISQQQAC